MDKNKYEVIRLRMERTAEALRKNNIYAVCAENKEEAVELVENLMDENSTVSVGGSMTLFETGIIDLLRNGKYEFLDRYEPGLSAQERTQIYRDTFFCDNYITSTNAVTEKGELYNVDGTGNRVAAMIFGPGSVIVVAGYNKIVADLDEAEKRVRNTAAPANAVRLDRKTPCTYTGKCEDCKNDGRICCFTTVIGRQSQKDRIKVILVGEELGY